MTEIRLERNLKIPQGPAFDALVEVISAIQRQEGAWRGFAVHVSLGDLHLPDVGYLAIPIQLVAGKPNRETHSVDIEFSAANHAASFPRFTGTVGVEAEDALNSKFRLAGNYDVPLRIFGKLFDLTVASGVAERTLENLADDLAAAVRFTVDKREAEYIRYHLY